MRSVSENMQIWDRPVPEHAQRFLLDYTYEELHQIFLANGFREAHAREVFAEVLRRFIDHPDQLDPRRTSQSLRTWLDSPGAPAWRVFREVIAHPSEDGSTKYVFTLEDGAKIESVYMPRGAYRTLCISSQVGCALGCTFCATGALGFKRNLSPGEMLGQVIHMRRMHREADGQPGRWNVVFMGMGEPLHNLANLMRAFDSLTHPRGMVLSQKDVAVSTAGLVPKIRELAKYPHRPRLMVSIAATTNKERSAVMPVNHAYSLEVLLETLENFPLQRRERIMLSYVLIAGVNDRDEDADRLITMSRHFPSLVNLIPMNAHPASPDMDEPEEEHLLRFARLLRDAGVFATIRYSRGRDVAAACGQLAAT